MTIIIVVRFLNTLGVLHVTNQECLLGKFQSACTGKFHSTSDHSLLLIAPYYTATRGSSDPIFRSQLKKPVSVRHSPIYVCQNGKAVGDN